MSYQRVTNDDLRRQLNDRGYYQGLSKLTKAQLQAMLIQDNMQKGGRSPIRQSSYDSRSGSQSPRFTRQSYDGGAGEQWNYNGKKSPMRSPSKTNYCGGWSSQKAERPQLSPTKYCGCDTRRR